MAKPFVGVVHLAPLPSSARGFRPFEEILQAALADATALAEGGVDGVLVENLGDAPFHRGDAGDPVPPDVPAALAVVAREVRRATGLPVAINCLRNDAVAAIGAAVVAGARWVRVNVLAGAYATDQGLLGGEAARVMAYRKRVGSDVRVLADLFVKHAAPLGEQPTEVAARDLAERSGADGLILTGRRTGEPVDPGLLQQVKEAVGAFPVWIGSGLTPANAAQLWPHCDGAIVGTALKRDGGLDRPVDVERVRALREALA